MIPTEKELLRRARVTAMILASFCIIALVSLTYAVIQQRRSKQSEVARLAQESKSTHELEMVTIKLEAALAELDKCRQK